MVNSFIAGSKPAYTLNSSVTILKNLNREYPETESFVNMFYAKNMDIRNSEKKVKQNVVFFNGDFLNVFTPDIIYGDITSFNQTINVCLISESFSEVLFGKKNSLGESLVLANQNDTIRVGIAGVIDDFQNTTCMQGDIFVKGEDGFDFYDNVSDLSFLLLEKNSKIDKLNNIPFKEYEHNGVNYKEGFFFQPISEVYLKSEFLNFNFYPSGNLKLLTILFIALLLMFSCIIFNYNFMFIVLIRARIKEFSIKRILGLSKRKLLYEIIADSTLFVLFAAFFGYIIGKRAMYSIESLNIVLKDYSRWFNEVFIIVFAIIIFLTIVIPLLYYKTVIRFGRINRLKNSNDSMNKKVFGIFFLAIQVIVAFVLLAFSFIVKSQLEFAVNRDLGFNNRDLVIIENDLTEEEYDLFAEELSKETRITEVTRIGKLPPSNFPQRMTRVKCNEDKKVLTAVLMVDQNTLETLGVKYIQGEGFQNYSNYGSYCVVSESLAE